MRESSVHHATFGHSSPMLPVRDLKRTIAWYKALRFSVGNLFGDPPEWCCLCYDDARLFFKQQPADASPPAASERAAEADHAACPPPQPGGPAPHFRAAPILRVQVDDLPAAHAELTTRGLAPTALRVDVDGETSFELRDPDGYCLWFGEETGEEPTVAE